MRINMYFTPSKIYKTEIYLSGLKKNNIAVFGHAKPETASLPSQKIHHSFQNSKSLLYFKLYRLF